MADKYSVVRFYQHGGRRVLITGLTLEEAQAHCQDPETSSRTCTKSARKAITKRNGPWFDGYGMEK